MPAFRTFEPGFRRRNSILASLAVSQRDWKEASTHLEDVLQIGTNPDEAGAIRKQLKDLAFLRKYGSPSVFSILDPDVQAPSLIAKTEPRYTKDARRSRINGDVLIWLEVDESGVPTSLQIVEGLGHGLNEKALEAVSHWRFKSATKNGARVRCGGIATVTFHLI
jgi:TonB family protein